MKVAIPIDGHSVAATFDFACQLLIVTCRNGILTDRLVVDIPQRLPSLRAAQLKEYAVNILLCGAISNPLAAMVWHQGINITCGISGDTETILQEYLRGGAFLSRYTLPGFSEKAWRGCCRRSRRRFRGGR